MTPREGVPVGPPPCGWSATKPTKVGRYLRQRDGVVSIVNLREARELWGGEDKTLTVLYEYCGRWISGEWPCAEGLWAPVPTHDAAHPAATAREEAWKAMVEALEQVVPDWLPESASEAAPVVKECYVDIAIRLVRARRALALARSTGGT